MDVLSGLTLAAPAGLNAYIPLLAVALAERLGWVHLREPFDGIGSWWVIGVIAVLLVVEVVADKVPAVDHVNDVIQTVVRPAAGGLLAVSASTQGTVEPLLLLIAGVLIAGGVHAVKATARPAVNVTTAGVGAPVVSTGEDILAVIGTVLALLAPVLAAVLIVAAVLLAVVLLRRRRQRAA
ncbi:MAG TPA: DUF4126 domain-containing protein [Thermoleophilia bacterium]|nr:DUF4126 domain-containing protein [Thermoleophilia bacterium]